MWDHTVMQCRYHFDTATKTCSNNATNGAHVQWCRGAHVHVCTSVVTCLMGGGLTSQQLRHSRCGISKRWRRKVLCMAVRALLLLFTRVVVHRSGTWDDNTKLCGLVSFHVLLKFTQQLCMEYTKWVKWHLKCGCVQMGDLSSWELIVERISWSSSTKNRDCRKFSLINLDPLWMSQHGISSRLPVNKQLP